MPTLTEQFQIIRQADQDVASVLDVFDEVDRVYHAALEAMGAIESRTDIVSNSAAITVTFQPGESAQSLVITG